VKELHELVTSSAGRLDTVVSQEVSGLSRSRVTSLIRAGAVQVEGQLVTRPSKKVVAGVRVVVEVPDVQPSSMRAQDLPLDIVYQDPHIAVVNKATGMVVHPGAGHHDGTLANALLHHLDDLSGIGGVMRPGIVHRLDRGTSGLMVVAKNDDAHADLARQFADHTAGRIYLAICHGAPKVRLGTVRSTLARHRRDRVRFASTRDGSGRHAVTHWERLRHTVSYSLLRCQLETGRTHQIRVHLSEQGWPLVGDPLYGGRRRLASRLVDLVPEGRVMLHATQLRLRHPDTNAVQVFRADPPTDFSAVVDELGLRDPTGGSPGPPKC